MSDQTKLVSPNLKHTPGPWKADTSRQKNLIEICTVDGCLNVADVWSSNEDEPCTEQDFADARLIAKSPVILDAIERAMAVLHPNAWSPESSDVARGEAFGILRAALEDLTA